MFWKNTGLCRYKGIFLIFNLKKLNRKSWRQLFLTCLKLCDWRLNCVIASLSPCMITSEMRRQIFKNLSCHMWLCWSYPFHKDIVLKLSLAWKRNKNEKKNAYLPEETLDETSLAMLLSSLKAVWSFGKFPRTCCKLKRFWKCITQWLSTVFSWVQ